MRTSRISKDTTKLAEALSSPRTRRTRNSNSSNKESQSSPVSSSTTTRRNGPPRTRHFPPSSTHDIANGPGCETDSSLSTLSSIPSSDIEDLLDAGPSLKRKRDSSAGADRSATNYSPKNNKTSSTRTSRSSRNATAQRSETKKKPTKRHGQRPRRAGGSSTGNDASAPPEPPPNWEEIYNIVRDMRLRNPTAPVDTVGCSELYWRTSSARDKRFHTLIALMLSSQTKDTVTALAMQRLHTELGGPEQHGSDSGGDDNNSTGPDKVSSSDGTEQVAIWDRTQQNKPSTLNLENVLAVSHARLNELINGVGFHNNKTKYIKGAALVLRDEFESDIPSTPEGLMRLPGVGPKMAYLCMSAAWEQHVGIGVDVHVHRITNLWGWQKSKTPEETRKALESWLPRDKWHEINKLLVGLGQTVCLPVGRRCGECDLAGTGLCKAEVKGPAGKTKGTAGQRKKRDEDEI